MRQFEHDFVDQLRIGPNDNQVGTIVFSNYGNVTFNLNAYNNKVDILQSILNINYPSGSTNTADGLCKLVRYGFADGHGARPTSGAVFRIAIVMTDGKSNTKSHQNASGTLYRQQRQSMNYLHQFWSTQSESLAVLMMMN